MSAVGDNFPCERCKNNKDDDCVLYFDCPLLVNYYMSKNIKVIKVNKIQQRLCYVICSQQDFWKRSNDITSPTHIIDIEEECFAQLDGVLKDKEVEEFGNRLKDLYWFIRRFDKL